MLYWMSFANKTGFLGACIAEGYNFAAAHYQTHQRGINPGGEVASLELPDADPNNLAPYVMWKLYSKDEIDKIDKAVPWNEAIE